MAEETYKNTINNSKTRKYVKMAISSSGTTEDVVFELFIDIAPLTCENFI